MTRILQTMISEWDLRAKFLKNEGGYKTRMHELDIKCIYDRPANPKSGQVAGTTSKMFSFSENGRTVMMLHCFLKPDGSLGGSGKFDPKNLQIDGVMYVASSQIPRKFQPSSED